jgi:hypothetical protein
MSGRKIPSLVLAALVVTATTIAAISPAAAWCRWGGCGWRWGWGWRAPVGVYVGAPVARPYYAGPAPAPVFECPAGYHKGPYGRYCWPN